MLSVIVVAMAGIAFVVTGDRARRQRQAARAASRTPGETADSDPDPTAQKPEAQPIQRRTVYVEVYNNSSIHGLAGDGAGGPGHRLAGGRLRQLGRRDPGQHRLLPTSARGGGSQLALDLGVSRLHPAVSPMSFDRLTDLGPAEGGRPSTTSPSSRGAVVEVRAGGMHKGLVVDFLVEELEAGGFLFAGDDLGDLEAFHAVADLRERGLDTLLVCSASDEQSALVELADVVVPGPDGVLDLLRDLTAAAPAGSNTPNLPPSRQQHSPTRRRAGSNTPQPAAEQAATLPNPPPSRQQHSPR